MPMEPTGLQCGSVLKKLTLLGCGGFFFVLTNLHVDIYLPYLCDAWRIL